MVLNHQASLPPRSRSVIALAIAAMAVTVWVLAMAAHCGLLRPESVAPHPPVPSLTSMGAEFAGSIGAPQLNDGSATTCDHPFAIAVLPRSLSTTLTAVGVAVVVAAVIGWQAQRALRSGRSPPYGLAHILTGQDLLTRLCLARR